MEAQQTRWGIEREKLFGRFSKDLQVPYPELTGLYKCPLCLVAYERSAISEPSEDPTLTLEHVIPDKLGKRLFVLTCKNCNNNVGGAKLDAQLHRKAQVESFFESGGTLAAEMVVSGQRLAISWSRKPKRDASGFDQRIGIIGGRTAPAAIEQSILTFNAGPSTFDIQYQVANERLVKVALLKVGYLLGFRRHGYRFVLTDKLDVVRDQIRNPSAALLPLDAVVAKVKFPTAPANSLLLIRKPMELDCVIAIVELKYPDKGNRYFGIVLPHWGSPTDLFERAERLRRAPVAPTS